LEQGASLILTLTPLVDVVSQVLLLGLLAATLKLQTSAPINMTLIDPP
jgi:hypothetical protein